jgi:hypothetical protein
MSQILGAFGLLELTVAGLFSLGGRFETYEPFVSIIFKLLGGSGKPRVLNQWIRGHDCIL